MNKIMITILGILMVICFSSSAYAFDATEAGDTLEIEGTGGGTLRLTPSPGTIFQGAITDTAFTIASCNDKADEDGIVYMLVSSDSKIYQLAQAVDSDGTMPDISLVAGTSDGTFTAKQ